MGVNNLTPDQDGSLLAHAWDGNFATIYRIQGSVVTKAAGSLPYVTGFTIDGDTGDFTIGYNVPRYQWGLATVDRSSNAVTTITSGMIDFWSVRFDPLTGDYWSIASGRVCLVHRRTGDCRPMLTVTGASSLTPDPVTGDVLVVIKDRIVRYARSGTALRTYGPYTGMHLDSVCEWGARKLWGAGIARPGSTFTVQMCFRTISGSDISVRHCHLEGIDQESNLETER